MEANRPLDANPIRAEVTAQVNGNQIILQFGGYDYILKSADPHAAIDMNELLPLFQQCIGNVQFQENISKSNLCEVELDTSKIDLYKKQGTVKTHLETYVRGVAQNVNAVAMRNPPLARGEHRAPAPMRSSSSVGKASSVGKEENRFQSLSVVRGEPLHHEEPAPVDKPERHVLWADKLEADQPGAGPLAEIQEIESIEPRESKEPRRGIEDEEEEEPWIAPGLDVVDSDLNVDAPSKNRFARVKEGFNTFTEKVRAKFSSKKVHPEEAEENGDAKLNVLNQIQSRAIKRKGLIESKLTQAARLQEGGPTVALSRKDYQPKFLGEINFLSKLKEIDLNNPVHVDKLTSFYAKMCVINQETHPESLIDLFADQGFYDALQQVIDNLNALSNSTDSQDVKDKLQEIKGTFFTVAKNREGMGQLIANGLAESGTREWLKQFIDYDNPVETSKNLTKIVQVFMKGMNKIEEEVPYEEKMEWASAGLKRLMSEWMRKEIDADRGIQTLEYFLKVAKSSASRGDYFTASCIVSAAPAVETLKTWKVGREKWRYNITNAFSRIMRKYDDLGQVQLLEKAIIHSGYTYAKQMRFEQKLSVEELGKPFRFSALGKLSKIELESNRLQKSGDQEPLLDPALTSKDFSLANFKEVQLLKKIRDLKDRGITSKLEIQAWRRLCAKMHVIQQAQKDHPFLLIHLFENKDFLEVLEFGAQKFKDYGEKSSEISTMFQGILDNNRAYRQSFQIFGGGEDEVAKNNAIEAVRGCYTEEERENNGAQTFTFAYGDREFGMHVQVKTDVARESLCIDGQEIQRSAQSHKVLEDVFKTLEKQGYPSQNLGKITEILTAQTFNGPLAAKANRDFGEGGQFTITQEKGSNVCSVRQEGEDLVFTKNVSFNKYSDPEDPPVSVIETTFSMRIPRSKFTESPFTIDDADVQMSYLFNEIQNPQAPGGV